MAGTKKPSWRTTGRVNLSLKPLQVRTLIKECERTGLTVSPVVNALINDWVREEASRRARQSRVHLLRDLAVMAAALDTASRGAAPECKRAMAILADSFARAQLSAMEVMAI